MRPSCKSCSFLGGCDIGRAGKWSLWCTAMHPPPPPCTLLAYLAFVAPPPLHLAAFMIHTFTALPMPSCLAAHLFAMQA